MPALHRLVALILFTFASPLSATDDLGDLARAYVVAHTSGHNVLPSYARQTGLACSACHYQFLTLTPFGRKFKLNGYTLTNQTPLTEKDSTNGGRLSLSPVSLFAGMLTAGLTHTKDDLPGTQNSAAALPQELSGFIAGRISSQMGLFSQFTYSGADGAFGIDNVDIRFADKGSIGNSELIYGATLNNSPSVQDLWNTTPVWGFPFIGSDAAPGGAAGTLIDEGLAQNVLGLGGYAMLANHVYGEVSVYRSALQGSAAPTSTTGAINGVAPYWRLGLQQEWEHQYLMIGTFGLHASLFPDALSGPKDEYTDIGVDAQFETAVGSGNVVLRGSYVHEDQTLDATAAAGGSANVDNNLKVIRVNASWYPKQWIGVTGGYFDTRGTTDAGLYSPDPVDGSANGSPKTDGFIGEIDLNPWENTRLGLQYTGYSNFNGAKSNYDGSGRDASGNNTLFGFVWLAF
jgi:hypothetical protein